MSEPPRIKIGDWTAKPTLTLLERNGRSVKVEPLAMEVLVYLATHPENVVSADELVSSVWKGRIVGDGAVYKTINHLRHALGDDPNDVRYIQTIPKRGYRLVAPVAHPELASSKAPGSASRDSAEPDGRHVFRWVTATAVLTAVLGMVLGSILWPTPEAPPVTRFDYDLPDGQRVRTADWRVLAISRDGRRFVYSTTDGLYLREMGELEARLISGSESESEPFIDTITFSPDGQSVAGWGRRGLSRIAISGGAPVPLTDPTTLFGINWQSDGTILYTQKDGIYRIAADGGTADRLIPLDEDLTPHGLELLPDGDSVLLSLASAPEWDAAQIVVQSLSTGERTEIGVLGNDPRYLPTGHIVYASGDTLFAVAFDPDTLNVSGGAVPVVQGIMRARSFLSGVAHYDVSDNGTLIYLSGDITPAAARTLVWVDRDGHEEPINAPPRGYRSPRISPDRTKVAITVRENQQEGDVWMWDFAREHLTRVTFGPGLRRYAVWSPEGDRIAVAYRPLESAAHSLLLRASDGAGEEESLAHGAFQLFPASFLRDAVVVYGDFTNAGGIVGDIAIVRLDDKTMTPLLDTAFREQDPEVSPDGRLLAFTSDESGNDEIYVRPFPEVDTGRWQVSSDGGTRPVWAPDGEELFYRNGDAVMAVRIETDPDFSAGTPGLLFGGYPVINQGGRDYDTLDGERFLMMKPVEDPPAETKVIVVQNWFEELKGLVPTE